MALSRSLAAQPLMDHRRSRRGHAVGRVAGCTVGAWSSIEGYRVVRKVGEGRRATVYLAQDMAGAEVALKVLRRESAGSAGPAAALALAREFAVPSALRSKHVLRVFELLHGDGYTAIAMEYLGGGHLGGLIARGLAPEATLALLRQAALALDALHRSGFAHGDVKPANLLLRSHDELVLADFGLARRLGAARSPSLPGLMVGTPRYAAPESQGGAVSTATDVYSLGVVCHEMLCGQPPFPGETVLEVSCQHLMAPVPRLPAGLERFQYLLDRMLDKQCRSRLHDGQAVLRQIDLIQDAAPLHPAPVGASASRCQR